MAKFLFVYRIRDISESRLIVEAKNRESAVRLFFVNVAGCFAEQNGNLYLISVLNLSNVETISVLNLSNVETVGGVD